MRGGEVVGGGGCRGGGREDSRAKGKEWKQMEVYCVGGISLHVLHLWVWNCGL